MAREKWEEKNEGSMSAGDEIGNQEKMKADDKGAWREPGSMRSEGKAGNRARMQESGEPGMKNEMESKNMEEETASMETEGAAGSMGEKLGKVGMSSTRGSSIAAQLQHYLRGVSYPAEKQDMMDTARSNSAPADIMSLMNKLPDKTYNAPMEVETEFGKIM